jgi:hypothetical protein
MFLRKIYYSRKAGGHRKTALAQKKEFRQNRNSLMLFN